MEITVEQTRKYKIGILRVFAKEPEDFKGKFDTVYIKAVVLCDDKVEVGDNVLAQGNVIVRVLNDAELIFARNFPKVLVEPDKFRTKLLGSITKGKLSDGDLVEVDMDDWDLYPKLRNKDRTAIIHKHRLSVEELAKILYPELKHVINSISQVREIFIAGYNQCKKDNGIK